MEHEKRNFWLLVFGRMVSLIGSGIQQVAIPLYILDLTGSGTIMGTFVLLTNLPRIVFGPFAGVLGDRFNRKRIMVYMDLARGAVILIMALLARMGSLEIVGLMIMQVLISTFDITFDPATGAMIADIIPSEKLNRANSILQGVNSACYIVGPALGGILYAIIGIEAVFLANGISFILSGITEMFIVYKQTTERKKISVKSTFTDIKDGFVYLASIPGLIMLLTFAMLSNFLYSGIFSVVLPFFTREVVGFSAQQYGYLETTWVIGILIGNIILGAFLAKKKATSLFKTGIMAEAFLFMIFTAIVFPQLTAFFGGNSWTYFFIIAILFISMGIFNALVNTPMLTMFQKKVESTYRSRVFSVISVLAQLITPIGAFLYGLGLDRFETHHLILFAGGANLIITVAFLFIGMTKALEDKEELQTATK
ncbi:MAG TPA: MFS transporter [Thermotogota bacterium]|nr:MFS transporter [Thermotogota bacterium]HPJ87797.1 MFS transporter [Thermotogota bacterium]HPR95205.1 MFS transporter [Thermotogota bacterium]